MHKELSCLIDSELRHYGKNKRQVNDMNVNSSVEKVYRDFTQSVWPLSVAPLDEVREQIASEILRRLKPKQAGTAYIEGMG